MGEETKRETTRADKRLESPPRQNGEDSASAFDTPESDDSVAPPSAANPPDSTNETSQAEETPTAEERALSNDAPTRFPWPNRFQEIFIASAGATGATLVASMLAGSGSSVETLERLSLLFCGLAALTTWFFPLPLSSPRAARIGSFAAALVVLYWLEPIRIAEIRGEHDLAHGTRTEKEAALERLIRLGTRDLAGADLRELNLSDADLANLNLKKANLSHSTLERALLLETDLSESDLSGASLRGANLTSATLDGANFGAGADSTRCDRFTQLPKSHECLYGSITARAPARSGGPKADQSR